LGDQFDRWVAQYADRPAISYQGREITYRQMDEYATRLAYHLAQMGIQTYDRVIFQLFNSPEVLYLFYACMKIGAVPICSLPTHRWAEISFFAKEAEARAHAIPAGVVQDFDYEEFAEQLRGEIPNLKHVLVWGQPTRPDMVSLDALIESDVDLATAREELKQFTPDPMEPAVFQLSGGTTGTPKIIPRTHNDYYYNAICMAAASNFEETDRFIAPLPMTHNAPLACHILPLHSVGGCLIPVAPKPEVIVQALMEDKPNYLILGGFLAQAIKNIPLEQRRQLFGGIKKIWAAAVNPQDIQEISESLGADCWQIFGMAEGLCTITRATDPLEIKYGTQGRGASEADEVKIVDPVTLEELPTGQIGEMICRGPYTIRGYYNSPERNKEAFTPDGFYRSGDLCKLDEQGNMTWCGRIKDCIDRGGEKVNAEEVEGHVLKFTKVNQVAVVAMPDQKLGERICAFVVPQPGATFDLEELRDFLLNERRIAKFKAPERLEFIEELPTTHVGKFEKKSLREKIAQILKEEGKV
jgi:2,3-dihydroxybenzoate-AMP ligase